MATHQSEAVEGESVGEVGDEEAPPRSRDVVEEIRKNDVIGRPNLHRNTS